MNPSARFRPAGARVIHETFDDEVVIVNLDSGRYYSVQQAGADIWQLMLAGCTVRQMAAALEPHYDAPTDRLAEAADGFCRGLCDEDLLVTADGEDAAASVPALPDRGRRAFDVPRLQVYTDMQDLLLLDPIHEVDAAGWPAVAPDTSDQ